MKTQLKRPTWPPVTSTFTSYIKGYIDGHQHSLSKDYFIRRYELHGAKLDTQVVFLLKSVLIEYDSLLASLDHITINIDYDTKSSKNRANETAEKNQNRIKSIRSEINGNVNDQLVAIDSEMRRRWNKSATTYFKAFEKASKTTLSEEEKIIEPYEYVGFNTIQKRVNS